jgi:hypothetical protein
VITKSAGNDAVSFADPDCDAGGVNLGSIDLGQTGYVSASAAFGTSDSSNCNGGHPSGASCTTVVWTTATKTLVITLGKLASGTPTTKNTAVVATYTAGSNSGFSGTKATASSVQF